eukprot:6210803-Pleurochrysis_carterae.AAC.1
MSQKIGVVDQRTCERATGPVRQPAGCARTPRPPSTRPLRLRTKRRVGQVATAQGAAVRHIHINLLRRSARVSTADILALPWR